MINKILSVFVGLSLLINLSLKADEGMWLLSIINKNYDDMKAKGFKLTPEDIYNINKACIKDAIAGLGTPDYPLDFFCSGEIISNEGLLLTNHHCGFEAIQSFSSLEHDYLSDGFWAMSKKDELSDPELTVSILIRIDDVTDRILKEIEGSTSESERNNRISKISLEIVNETENITNSRGVVKKMFEGNQFFLFIYQTYYDIRLVGAPPSSIGKFGGDTDNWMWPRHTGDFSMFRIYTAPDGNPAKYSKNNIPLKPKYFFPISLKGVKKDDFTMVVGFPGTTTRYMTSSGVKEAIDVLNPIAIKIRTKKLDIIKAAMDNDNKVRIQYSSKYAESSNYWKFYIGQNQDLKKLNVFELKKAQEESFTKWINSDNLLKKKYGDALSLIQESYMENKTNNLVKQYILEAFFQGPEIIMFPYQAEELYNILLSSPDDTSALNNEIEKLKDYSKNYFKNYNVPTDKKLFSELMKIYYIDVPVQFHLDIFNEIEKKYKGNFEKFTDAMFEKSIFTDEARFYEFIHKPNLKDLENDFAYKLMQNVLQIYFQFPYDEPLKLQKGNRLFVQGLMEMQKDKLFYPDANSSIRLTYGQVEDYKAKDAVFYNYYTTLTGIIEKEDSTNEEFIVPSKLKELYSKKDFGRYSSKEDGQIRICFITNNDITGGNSGSPVINGNGELVGTAFDGNWEAMSGDISFENNYQRCINLDIRYTLFIIDKFAGAKNLIDEMKIVE